MAVELSSHRQGDFDEQVRVMSLEQIFDQLGRDNRDLAKLGVRCPISDMIWSARSYGRSYEYRRNKSGGLRSTPMNCFMALLHHQADLRELPQGDFEKLAEVVSRVAVATEALEKTGGFVWPDQFTHNPQRLLTSEPTV